MRKLSLLFTLLSFWLFISTTCWGQQRVIFQATWDFNNQDLTGVSSQSGVVAAPLATKNVTVSSVLNTAYPNSDPPGSRKAFNTTSWATGCSGTDYIEVTVTPQSGKDITITSFDFLFTRSNNGPTQIQVTSSATGYSLSPPLYSATITASTAANTVQSASIPLVGPGYTNQTGPVTFRIIGCDPVDGTGALRLDNIVISGDVKLPADLLSFSTQPDGDGVTVSWITGWERDLDRFAVQRSADLGEFLTIGSVSARGNSDHYQAYSFTDDKPLPGTSYYRLRQVDQDGAEVYSKVIPVRWQPGAATVRVQPNPANPDRICLRLTNSETATVDLWTLAGQSVRGHLAPTTANTADFLPDLPLLPGVYVLRVQQAEGMRTALVVVK